MRILIFLSFIFYLCGCSNIKTDKVNYYKSIYYNASVKDWDIISINDSYLENNVWGKEYLRNNYQIIFADSLAQEFGWYWDYKLTSKRISATPKYVFGKSPWAQESSTNDLPICIDSIENFSTKFTYQAKGTGNFENSISLWISNTLKGNSNEIALQMVCIFGSVGTDYLGEYKDTITISNYIAKEFNYSSNQVTFPMVLFYFETSDKTLNLNLKSFLNYLISKGVINSNNYISSLEMGTSIKWGKGETIFKNFNCQIEKK